jgi:phosphatidate phosphatase APP1
MKNAVRQAIVIVAALLLLTQTFAAEKYSVIFHDSYGDSQHLIIHGRLLVSRQSVSQSINDGAMRNVSSSIKTLHNKAGERLAVHFTVGDHSWSTRTDHEGYFSFETATPSDLGMGWHAIETTGATILPPAQLLIVPPENKLGIISDIDDTVVVSEVLNKRKLIANTYFKNPAQRKAVPGVAAFYSSIAQKNVIPDQAPIIYLSASPSQLHDRIQTFLDLNHYPRGVLITKKINKEKEADPWLNQIKFKTQQIELMLQRLPHVRFILVGDDGEKDPETYHGIATRFPERIEAVYIRRVNPDKKRIRYAEQHSLEEVLQ